MTTQVLGSLWDIKSITVNKHMRTPWVTLLSVRPCNVILMVTSLAVICYGTCHFEQQPALIGQSLRRGGLDTLHPRSVSQLLQSFGVNNSGMFSQCVLDFPVLFAENVVKINFYIVLYFFLSVSLGMGQHTQMK